MSISNTSSEGTSLPRQSSRPQRRGLLRVYYALVVIFLLGIVAQVFLAGAGIFASASWLSSHRLLGTSLPLIPLLMLIVGPLGRLPRKVNWLTFLLFALVYIQPWFIYISRGLKVPILGALHPVNALALFTLPLYLLYRTHLILHMSNVKQP